LREAQRELLREIAPMKPLAKEVICGWTDWLDKIMQAPSVLPRRHGDQNPNSVPSVLCGGNL